MTTSDGSRSEWPVLVVDGGPDASNHKVNEEFFEVLAEALERGERFGLVVVKDTIDLARDTHRSDAEREGIRWLKTARDAIGERCAGIAYVLAPEILEDERWRPLLASGDRVYGCPTAAFTDLDSACRWVEEALEPG